MHIRRIIPLVAPALLLLCCVMVDGAEAQTDTVTWSWTRAESSAGIKLYLVQMFDTELESWEYVAYVRDESITIVPECNQVYLVRVSAIDLEGREGPFSPPSESYTHDCSATGGDDPDSPGAPGAPGTPQPIIRQ